MSKYLQLSMNQVKVLRFVLRMRLNRHLLILMEHQRFNTSVETPHLVQAGLQFMDQHRALDRYLEDALERMQHIGAGSIQFEMEEEQVAQYLRLLDPESNAFDASHLLATPPEEARKTLAVLQRERPGLQAAFQAASDFAYDPKKFNHPPARG